MLSVLYFSLASALASCTFDLVNIPAFQSRAWIGSNRGLNWIVYGRMIVTGFCISNYCGTCRFFRIMIYDVLDIPVVKVSVTIVSGT